MNVDFQMYRSTHGTLLPDIPSGPIFVGRSVDARGDAALQFVSRRGNAILLEYDASTMQVAINEESPVDADDVDRALTPLLSHTRTLVLEATTLGIAEIFLAIQSAIKSGIDHITALYLEPKDYSRDSGSVSYDLSDAILGFRPIPSAAVDLSSPDLKRGVFFVGYEPARLDRAFEEHQMISPDSSSVVFGLPGFRAGWELDAIVPHLTVLQDRELKDIQYCAADNPSAAYDYIQLVADSLQTGETMFVAPLGTKPVGIAAAIAAAIDPEKIGLLYDHPQRKAGRSRNVGMWHLFDVIVA